MKISYECFGIPDLSLEKKLGHVLLRITFLDILYGRCQNRYRVQVSDFLEISHG